MNAQDKAAQSARTATPVADSNIELLDRLQTVIDLGRAIKAARVAALEADRRYATTVAALAEKEDTLQRQFESACSAAGITRGSAALLLAAKTPAAEPPSTAGIHVVETKGGEA